MLFNSTTAKAVKRRFNGSRYGLWTDAHGNIQLCCYSDHDKGHVLVDKSTMDAFVAMACEGAKSVRFANPVSRLDITVDMDELSKLDAIDGRFSPYYLVATDTFSDDGAAYPGLCAVA